MHDLNIDVIYVNTPAVKGRVERANQTLQDRLVYYARDQRSVEVNGQDVHSFGGEW